MRHHARSLLLLLPLLLVPALAHAQSISSGDSSPITTSAQLAILGCMALTYALKRFAPQGAFFHSQTWSFIAAGLSAVAGAVTQSIQQSGLHWSSIEVAVIACASSLLAQSNPSTPIGQRPPLARPTASGIGPAMMLLAFASAAVGCAHLPPSVQQYDSCLTTTLEQDGISQIPGYGTQILQILEQGGTNSAAIETAIESVVIAAGGDAAVLVANSAVYCWFEQNPVAGGARPTPSQAAARIYLAKHTAAPGVRHGAWSPLQDGAHFARAPFGGVL